MLKNEVKFHVLLQGGLANQLYIYTFFQSIKNKYNHVDVIYDINSLYNNDFFKRKYRLEEIGLILKQEDSNSINKYFSGISYKRIKRISLNFLLGPNYTGFIDERSFPAEKLKLSLRKDQLKLKNYIVYGYWQYKNFEIDCEKEINDIKKIFDSNVSFSSKKSPTEYKNTLGIHIRKLHAACKASSNDYIKVINESLNIYSSIQSLNCFISQDANNYFQENIYPHLNINSNVNMFILEGSDIQDMYTISKCKVLILTKGSTYSQWIKFLSDQNNKETTWV